MKRIVALMLFALLGATSCYSGQGGDRVTVVAAFYPLAWAARHIAPQARIEDLTPRGGEPHDLQLNAKQRLDVLQAKVVFLLGQGFQPAVERAARDSHGYVVDLLRGVSLLPSGEEGLSADPHVWLDPRLMQHVAQTIGDAFAFVDPEHADDYHLMARALASTLDTVDTAYRSGLSSCDVKTIVTTHEAFGYLSREYGLRQMALTGLTPEAEPSAAALQGVRVAAAHHQVDAIFFEATDEGRRIGRSVARDVGLPSLPLSTLESNPAPQDYLSGLDANLDSLRKGLRCR